MHKYKEAAEHKKLCCFFRSIRKTPATLKTESDLMIFIQAFFHGELFDRKIFDSERYGKLQLSMFPVCYGSGYMRIKMGGFSTSFLGQGDLVGHSGSTGSFAFYYPAKELFFVGDFNQMKYPALPVRFVIQLAMFAP